MLIVSSDVSVHAPQKFKSYRSLRPHGMRVYSCLRITTIRYWNIDGWTISIISNTGLLISRIGSRRSRLTRIESRACDRGCHTRAKRRGKNNNNNDNTKMKERRILSSLLHGRRLFIPLFIRCLPSVYLSICRICYLKFWLWAINVYAVARYTWIFRGCSFSLWIAIGALSCDKVLWDSALEERLNSDSFMNFGGNTMKRNRAGMGGGGEGERNGPTAFHFQK